MQIRNSIYCLICIFFVLIVNGCGESDYIEDIIEKHDGYELSLNLQCAQIDTRSDQQVDGVEGLNENLIKSIDCFFYLSGSDDNAQAVCKQTVRNLKGEKNLEVKLFFNDSDIEKMFPSSATQCKIYVIANLPSDIKINPSNTSINELKKIIITNNSFVNNTTQESFVMDAGGSDIVTLDSANKKLSGSVGLKRSATKITLTVTSIKDVYENKGTPEQIHWIANPDQITAYMKYGVKKTHIDADKFPYTPVTEDYFSMPDDKPVSFDKKTSTVKGITSSLFEQKVPFYSYPSSWQDEDAFKPYILLVVPWKKEGVDNVFYPCYYQIPINSKGSSLLRNHYYKINLSVSTLGSFEKETPLVIKPSYVIADWGTNTIDATLTDFRYLMVEQTHILLNNRDVVEIKYSSSHPIEIVNAKITQTDLHSNIPTEKEIIDNFTIVDTPNEHYIKYERKLNNTFTDPLFDLTPYSINFTVQHADKPEYNEKITMTQYPAIYAMYERNSDFISETETVDNNNKNHGYVFVNGYYSTDFNAHESLDKQDFFCSAAGIKGYSGNDYSPNRYIFTITSVRGTNYAIGDPRVSKPSAEFKDAKRIYNNPDNNATAWVQAPYLDETGVVINTNRGLENYYPTDDSDNTLNMVSPKFMIASTYGAIFSNVTEGHYLDAIRKRCASYQEDGYPAGRWRIPTKAEMEFVIYLVNKKKLPPIYNLGETYWSAHGLCHIDPNNGDVSLEKTDYDPKKDHSVRCVYDLWYWKDKIPEDNKNQFVWGDRLIK